MAQAEFDKVMTVLMLGLVAYLEGESAGIESLCA